MPFAPDRRRISACALLCVMAVLLTGIPAAGGETPSWNVDRVAGADRYDTAAQLSARIFPEGADEVLVASGETFADALAAGPAAARREGPLLLTLRDRVPKATADELRRLQPGSIVVAGGEAAVSKAVEFALATIAPVTRIAGADRFETATKLATDGFGTGVPVVFLANGRRFPDALAAGAVGGRLGGASAARRGGHGPRRRVGGPRPAAAGPHRPRGRWGGDQ